jgi:hypothetical protein
VPICLRVISGRRPSSYGSRSGAGVAVPASLASTCRTPHNGFCMPIIIAAQISCIILSSSAPSCTLFQSRSLAGQSIPAGPEPETEPDMPIYPLELCKRLEEKWKRRAGETGSTSQTPQTGKNRSVVGSAPQEEGDAILSRWPWLLAIGQGLQSEYAALKQPVEKRLVTLLKKLRRSRAR